MFKSINILLISTFMLFGALQNAKASYPSFFSSSGCSLMGTYVTSFDVNNQNGGGYCRGQVEFELYVCSGPPDTYKLFLKNIDIIGCDNSPGPDGDDVVNAAQRSALLWAEFIIG